MAEHADQYLADLRTALDLPAVRRLIYMHAQRQNVFNVLTCGELTHMMAERMGRQNAAKELLGECFMASPGLAAQMLAEGMTPKPKERTDDGGDDDG